MRIITALALAAVAATAAPSLAAPARGVSFTDPAGDANGTDGANGTGSQAALDVRKVTLSPFQRTAKSSGVTVRVELAAAPSTAPGTSYVFSATQWGCTLTVSRTVTAEGVSSNEVRTCGTGSAGTSHDLGSASLVTSGNAIVFTVPADDLVDSSLGAGLKDIEVSTTIGDPAAGMPSPRRIDRALCPRTYRLGT